MKLGVISDIHGNMVSLEAVLAILDREKVDQIVCLGDVAELGPQPHEVIECLRDRRIRTAIGNADAWLVPNHPAPVTPSDSHVLGDITLWGQEQLTSNDVEWLLELPMTLTVSLPAGTSLFGFHASPTSVEQVISATTPGSEIRGDLPVSAGTIFANGHTHIQLLRRVDQGRLLNPGSVGLPGIGPGLPDLPTNEQVDWAEFAVISTDDGATEFALHRVAIDLEAVLSSAERSGMPHFDWWRGLWAG